MIPQATIDQIIETAPIVDIIRRDVPTLKRAGREWRGLSPFKNERTPSFFVNESKHRWFDFSSGMNGTVISFLQELKRWTFPEAVQVLAGEMGIKITGTEATRESENTKALKRETQKVLDVAHLYYLEMLRERPEGKAYAKGRGLTGLTCRDMGIGYAPPESSGLLAALKGFSPMSLEASALFVADDPKKAFLRNRLVFPIRDRRGLVVSFGGRAIDNGEPKYLNGRQSLLFDKGRNLFNLSAAEKPIREEGRALVMEGYIDVAIARQHGIANVVAPMGTALSLEQAWLLWRQAPEIGVCLDGDAAGDRASARLLEATLPALAGDRRLAFIRLPSGLDPDDHLRTHGRSAFDALLRGAESCIDRIWRAITGQLGGSRADQEAQARKLAKELTEEIADDQLKHAYRSSLMDRAWKLGRGRSQGDRGDTRFDAPSISGREAAIAYAAATEPRYVDACAERLAALGWHAPLAGTILGAALGAAASGQVLNQDMMGRDLSILRSSIPQPAPSFVRCYDAESFSAALDVQAEQERKRKLRAMQ
jgi:DNA primase